jgi:hypothetical protein
MSGITADLPPLTELLSAGQLHPELKKLRGYEEFLPYMDDEYNPECESI